MADENAEKMPYVRTFKRITQIVIDKEKKRIITGHKSPYTCSYYFQNNFTKIPNDYHVCPPVTARLLFEMTVRWLAEALLAFGQEMTTYRDNALYVTITFDDGSYKRCSWEKPCCTDLDGLFDFSEFNYFRSNHLIKDGEPFELDPSAMFFDWAKRITLEHVRYIVNQGEIPFWSFFDRVKDLMEDDEGFDAKVVVNLDNSIKIVRLTLGTEFPTSETVQISPDGEITKADGLAYVQALQQNGVKVLVSKKDLAELKRERNH